MVIMIKCLNGTKEKHLYLSGNDLKVVKWYVNTSFVVHPYSKSHTGAIVTIGQVAMQSFSRK